jgi:hypothetical protein
MCGSFLPGKADPILVIDTNAVLTFAIAFQGFEPIADRYTQVF